MQGKRCCLMSCEYCGKDTGHHSQCPLYIPPKVTHYCPVCDQGIYNGEQYVVDDGELYHHDCFYRMKGSINRLKYEINTMEEY